jgi:transcriptional regulator with XRE-family HTH domain
MKWGEVERTLHEQIERTSQGEVARGIGISESTLSRWLAQESTPTGTTRERLYRWAEAQHVGTPPRAEMPAQLYGQTIEVEALLRYALARQEALRDTLKAAMDATPPAAVGADAAKGTRRATSR